MINSLYEAKRQVTTGAYTTEVLLDTPSLFSTNSEIQLNGFFDNYDELKIYLCLLDNNLYNHFKVITIPKDVLMKSYADYNDPSIEYQYKGRFTLTSLLYTGNTDYIMTWQVIAKDYDVLLCGDKAAKYWSPNACFIYKIVGVKYTT